MPHIEFTPCSMASSEWLPMSHNMCCYYCCCNVVAPTTVLLLPTSTKLSGRLMPKPLPPSSALSLSSTLLAASSASPDCCTHANASRLPHSISTLSCSSSAGSKAQPSICCRLYGHSAKASGLMAMLPMRASCFEGRQQMRQVASAPGTSGRKLVKPASASHITAVRHHHARLQR